jgi:prolyl oligopeptidase
VVDTLHGVAIADDYRWLEDQEAPETRAWIVAQNAYTEQVVGASPLRDRIRARLTELMDREDIGDVETIGDHQYFTMRRRGEPHDRVYRRPLPEDADAPEPTAQGEYEVVLDPTDFDPGQRVTVDLREASPDNRYRRTASRTASTVASSGTRTAGGLPTSRGIATKDPESGTTRWER